MKPMGVSEFVNTIKQNASRGLIEVSGDGVLSTRKWEFPKGRAEVTTIRGGAIEKASIMHLELTGDGAVGAPAVVIHEVYQMEVFPQNPYCPMGHFNTELYIKEPRLFYLNLDLFPAVAETTELNTMKNAMDAVADRYGRDKDGFREGLEAHYTMPHFRVPLAAGVGCKLPGLKENEFELLVTAYETFLDTYLEVIDRNKTHAFAETDIRLKLERNGKWLQYLTVKDRAFRGAGDSGIPGEMLIEMGFPPSAAF